MNVLGLLAAFLGIELEETIATSRRMAIVYAILAALGVVAAVFLLIAAYLALTDWFGPIWAAVVIAVAALLIAAIVYLIARRRAEVAHREALLRRRSESTALASTMAVSAVPLLLKSPLIRDVGIPLGAAIAAFYIANRLDSSDDDRGP